MFLSPHSILGEYMFMMKALPDLQVSLIMTLRLPKTPGMHISQIIQSIRRTRGMYKIPTMMNLQVQATNGALHSSLST